MERPKAEITFHELRHIYENNLYKEIEKEVRLKVSNLLGHSRDKITKVYVND